MNPLHMHQNTGQARNPLVRLGTASRLALVVVMSTMLGCSEGERAPDVAIIVMDTVRQDHMSAFGYERPTTPQLEKLQARSASFPRAWSTSAWTVPAHASILTGLYSAGHRATQENWTLDPALDTLAEILGRRGYQTAAVIGNGMLSAERNFGQGFAQYVEIFRGGPRGQGSQAVRDSKAVDEIDSLLAYAILSRPLFLFVNLIGPHSPYDSPRDQFVSDPSLELIDNHWLDYYRGVRTLSEAELQHLTERYDGELIEVDAWLGQIVESLDRYRGLEDMLLVVTSDHGENFGDHGHMDHVFSLHESLTRVPLVVHYPPLFEPGSEDLRPAQLLDVFATALSVAGVDPSTYGAQGRDLSSPADPERSLLLELYRPEQAIGRAIRNAEPDVRLRLERWNHPLNAVVQGDWKLIVRGNGERELYDLANDPTEQNSLASDAAQADRVARLELELERLRERFGAAAGEGTEHVEANEETQRAMRALGYNE